MKRIFLFVNSNTQNSQGLAATLSKRQLSLIKKIRSNMAKNWKKYSQIVGARYALEHIIRRDIRISYLHS